MIYYEDSWDGWTKGNRKNLRAREGYLYPGEFGQILDGTTYSEATRVLEHLSKTGMELNYNRLVAGTGQMKGYAQKIECLGKRTLLESAERYDRIVQTIRDIRHNTMDHWT